LTKSRDCRPPEHIIAVVIRQYSSTH
jgi:hypothetical protein